MSSYTPGAVAGSIAKTDGEKEKKHSKLLALFSADIPKPKVITESPRKDETATPGKRKRKGSTSEEVHSPKKSKVKKNDGKVDQSPKDSKAKKKKDDAVEKAELVDRIEQRENRKKKKRDVEKDQRTIFVGNLPNKMTQKRLMTVFKKYGSIDSIRFRSATPSSLKLPKKAVMITKSFHPELDSMNGYIVFTEKESAVKALESNGEELDGKHIRVDLIKSKEKHNHAKSVFVGNLPFAAQEDDLRKHFEDCGEIENVRIVRDNKTGLGKGFCFILFEEKDGVDFALKLNESVFKDRKLRVHRSQDVSVTGKKTKKKEKKIGGRDSVKLTSKKSDDKKETKKKAFSRNMPSNMKTSDFQGVKAKRFEQVKKRQTLKKQKRTARRNALKVSATLGISDKPKAGDDKTQKAVHKTNGAGKPKSLKKGKDELQNTAVVVRKRTERSEKWKKADKRTNKATKGFKPKGVDVRSRDKKKMRKSKFNVKKY